MINKNMARIVTHFISAVLQKISLAKVVESQ